LKVKKKIGNCMLYHRVKYVHDNQLRLNKSQGFFITKMSAMYQKDREQWNFVTSLEQRKNAIIQQNIY
jgi:hypothetical protein